MIDLALIFSILGLSCCCAPIFALASIVLVIIAVKHGVKLNDTRVIVSVLLSSLVVAFNLFCLVLYFGSGNINGDIKSMLSNESSIEFSNPSDGWDKYTASGDNLKVHQRKVIDIDGNEKYEYILELPAGEYKVQYNEEALALEKFDGLYFEYMTETNKRTSDKVYDFRYIPDDSSVHMYDPASDTVVIGNHLTIDNGDYVRVEFDDEYMASATANISPSWLRIVFDAD